MISIYMLPKFDKPRTIHVELTDNCNAKCPVCVRRHYGGKLNPIIENIELGVSYFKDQLGIDFCKNVEYWEFCGTKGDPIACTELLEIIEFLKECNPKVTFTIHTNGGFRSKEWWYSIGDFFNKTNSTVIWGIDGLEDTNHIYRRNVKWKKLWENLNAYTNAGGKSIWQFLEFDHNKHQIPQIEKICKEKGIELMIKDPVGFNYIKKSDFTVIEPIEVFNEDGSHSYSILPKNANDKNIKVVPIDEEGRSFLKDGIKFLQDLGQEKYKINCKVGVETTDLYIDCHGAFIPCCYIGAGMYIGGIDPQLKEQFKNLDDFIPSKNNPYTKIFQNEYFSKTIYDGITGNLDGKWKYTVKCVETCGQCLN